MRLTRVEIREVRIAAMHGRLPAPEVVIALCEWIEDVDRNVQRGVFPKAVDAKEVPQ
jgi:hypothetical protein